MINIPRFSRKTYLSQRGRDALIVLHCLVLECLLNRLGINAVSDLLSQTSMRLIVSTPSRETGRVGKATEYERAESTQKPLENNWRGCRCRTGQRLNRPALAQRWV